MAWFFTSDTHFNHASIMRHSARPFTSLEEMNESIISKWNDRITRADNVVHCGDFAFGKRADAEAILKRLNGNIHMMKGNHDKIAWQFRNRFASFRDIAEFKVDGRIIVACHYCLRTWNRAHYGAIHVHGHSHGSLTPNPAAMDIGTDTNNFTPYSAAEVFAIVDSRPFIAVDHHTATPILHGKDI
jgi:calcineurin-like phosphoesterase family protein